MTTVEAPALPLSALGQAALAYAERGIPIFPVRLTAGTDGRTKKTPLIGKTKGGNGHLDATTNPDTIRTWWTRHPAAAIGGYLGGAGLVAIDVDIKEGKQGDDQLAALEAQHGKLPDTVEVLTPTGGWHLWYRYEGDARPNLGPDHPDIDVRGRGFWVVLPPSQGPEGAYEFEANSDFLVDGIAPADAPDWLARLIAPAPTPTAPAPAQAAPTAGDRPGDIWAALTPWPALLEPRGFTLDRVAGNEQYWTRPGKTGGTSATIGFNGSDVLVIWSSAPEVQALGLEAWDPVRKTTYTKFGFLAATRFGGDYAEAARWCKQWLEDNGHTTPRSTTTSDGLVWQPATPTTVAGAQLPDTFWNARPTLATIRQAAHAATRSADAVLGVTLARVAALTPPTLRLPAPVGMPASLNIAVALIGNSGTGKSTSNEVAQILLPITDPMVATVSVGSGEGLIEAYMGDIDEPTPDGKTRKVRGQVRRGILAELDEGQALGEIGSRKGSTLLPTIRSAWSGSRLGQANASAERRRQLAAHSYRFALIAGFQTEHATTLLDDAAGGTPQRFLWLPAEDPTIPDQPPPWPDPIDWRPPRHTSHPMGLDPDVATEIRARNLARARGHTVVAPLDAHRDLSRLKVAGLLAILDDRTDITTDDWHLAGLILDTSDHVRSTVAAAAAARAADTEHATIARQLRREAASEQSAQERALGVNARAIGRHVHRGRCEGGCNHRCTSRALTGAYRKLAGFDDSLDHAIDRGWVTTDGTTIRPGESRPT